MTGDDERLVLGVDGGQTGTVGLLATAAGRILGVGHAGPSNHFREAGGPERLRAAAEQVIQTAFQSAQLPPRRMACVCYGLTGKIEAMRPTLLETTLLETTPAESVLLVGDTESAHMGALAGEPGVIVISGTGSIAFGINRRGESASAGGWGYLIGDEGSGHWIAMRALGAVTQAADGRGRPTRLTEGILHALAVGDLGAMHAKMYYQTPSRPEIAGLAAVVGRMAAEGDAVAQEIMAAAGHELARSVVAVLRRLDMLAEPAPVAPVSGVSRRAGELIIGPLRAGLQAEAPQAYIVTPRYLAVVGSLLLALRALDIPITPPLLAQIDATLSPFSEALK